MRFQRFKRFCLPKIETKLIRFRVLFVIGGLNFLGDSVEETFEVIIYYKKKGRLNHLLLGKLNLPF